MPSLEMDEWICTTLCQRQNRLDVISSLWSVLTGPRATRPRAKWRPVSIVNPVTRFESATWTRSIWIVKLKRGVICTILSPFTTKSLNKVPGWRDITRELPVPDKKTNHLHFPLDLFYFMLFPVGKKSLNVYFCLKSTNAGRQAISPNSLIFSSPWWDVQHTADGYAVSRHVRCNRMHLKEIQCWQLASNVADIERRHAGRTQ